MLFCRYRKTKNSYSWGPLVNALQKVTKREVVLLRKQNISDETKAAMKMDDNKSNIFYFDSFMTVDVEEARKDLLIFLGSLNESQFKRTTTAAGGAHPTSEPVGTLDIGFNIAARGEGEFVIQRIFEVITAGKNWREIPGICFKMPQDPSEKSSSEKETRAISSENKVIWTALPPPINLDDYLPYSVNPPIHPPIEVMRGCPHSCQYCQTTSLHGGKTRFRSLKSIAEIVKHYAEHFPSPVDIRVIAPNILAFQTTDPLKPNIKALMEFVEIVQQNKGRLYMGSFPSEVRPESVTEEACKVLSFSHTKVVSVGGQSGSDSMLKKMHRGHTAQQILQACEILKKGGLCPLVDFILGCPSETEDEQLESIAFMNKLVDDEIHIRLHYFMPLPGTPWGEKAPTPLSAKILSLVGALLRRAPFVDGPFARQMEDSLLIAKRFREQEESNTEQLVCRGKTSEGFDIEELTKFVDDYKTSEIEMKKKKEANIQRKEAIKAEKNKKRKRENDQETSNGKRNKEILKEANTKYIKE